MIAIWVVVKVAVTVSSAVIVKVQLVVVSALQEPSQLTKSLPASATAVIVTESP